MRKIENVFTIEDFCSWFKSVYGKPVQKSEESLINKSVGIYNDFFREKYQKLGGSVSLIAHLHSKNGMVFINNLHSKVDLNDFDSVRIIGNDIYEEVEYAVFACKLNGNIHIYYGYVNSGYF